MAKKSKTAIWSDSVPAALLTGIITALALTILGAAITAWLIGSERIGESGEGTGSWITVFLAAAAGSWTASAMAGKKKLQLCLVTGGIYFLLLLSITALFFDGQYSGIIINGIIILSAAAAAALVGMKKGNSGKRRSWKRAYR